MDINSVIERYKKTAQGRYLLKDPEHTVSNCGHASWDFAAFVGVGNVLNCYHLADLTKRHPYWVGVSSNHAVFLYNKKVVDWTFQQFNPIAPCPLIEPIKTYVKRFKGRTELAFAFVTRSRIPINDFIDTTEAVREEVLFMQKNPTYQRKVLAQERLWLELSVQGLSKRT